jgi:hypothetical protein
LLKRSGRLYDGLMAELDGAANENRLVWREGDPDSPYVREYLAKTMAHFRECDIHFAVVVRELLNSLIRYAPGDPYEKLPDEGDIEAGLSCLVPAADKLKLRAEAYWKASRRLHADRLSRLAEKLGCDEEEAFLVWCNQHKED